MPYYIFKNITKLATRLGIHTVADLMEYKKAKNVRDTQDLIKNLIYDVENAPKRNLNSYEVK